MEEDSYGVITPPVAPSSDIIKVDSSIDVRGLVSRHTARRAESRLQRGCAPHGRLPPLARIAARTRCGLHDEDIYFCYAGAEYLTSMTTNVTPQSKRKASRRFGTT